jgi:hypothetical protein
VSKYDIENVCFVDFETKALPGTSESDGSVKTAGTYRYAKNTFAILMSYAIGEEPFECLQVTDFENGAMRWDMFHQRIHAHHKRVLAGEAVYAAFNAGFDRNIWNEATYDFPPLEPEHMIDVMLMSTGTNLAASLEGASKNIGRDGKQKDGKYLIGLFCMPGSTATPQSHPAEWARFVSYAHDDGVEMREVFKSVMPRSEAEWIDYTVSERINRRGMMIDVEFVRRAAAIADFNKRRMNADLTRWTNGQITAVTQRERIADLIYDRMAHAEAREILVTAYDEDASAEDDEQGDLKPAKLSIARDRIEAVLAFYRTLEEREGELSQRDQLIVDILDTRLYGASTASAKFDVMLNQVDDDDRAKGQYVAGGAQQTDRFSSKGIQVHNLTRSTLGAYEVEAIELINELEI